MASEICLVSKNDILREGLRQILMGEGFNVLKSVENIEDLVLDAVKKDCLVILECDSSTGLVERFEAAIRHCPDAKIVLLADDCEPKAVMQCFIAGAQGYVLKSLKCDRIVAALRLAALGEKVLPSSLVDVIGGSGMDYAHSADVDREIEKVNLSPREVDVLCCLMAGYPNKVIARQLDVCEATVKVHVKAILRKLDVRNRTQAALWANSHGMREGMQLS